MSSTVWVGGKGEGYFEVELIFENIKLEDKHIQEPAGCYEAVKKQTHFVALIDLTIWMLEQNDYHSLFCNMRHLFMTETQTI